MHHKHALFVALLAAGLAAAPSRGADEPPKAAPTPSAPASAAPGRPLDGVPIEAVEVYSNPKSNEFGISMGFFPFNPYYNGLSLGAGYAYHFSQNFAWELAHVDYVFAFDKGLRTELADRYSVNPQDIETLKYIVSTNGIYTFSYGKFVLFKDYIRYFRAGIIFGVGMTATSQVTSLAGSTGLRLQVFTNERFSWRLELRNSTTIPDFDNNASFTLGPAVSF